MFFIKDAQLSGKAHTQPEVNKTAVDVQWICNMLNPSRIEFHYHPPYDHLSFSVLMDIKARIIAIIQNRTVTLDSGHPFNSKW